MPPTADHDDPVSRARIYLAKIPTATEGHRNHTLNEAAFNLTAAIPDLHDQDLENLLLEFSRAFSPPMPEQEAITTIRGAIRAARAKCPTPTSPPHPTPTTTTNSTFRRSSTQNAPRNDGSPSATSSPRYNPKEVAAVPFPSEPVPDGARALLRAIFRPGEGIRITDGAFNDDDPTPSLDAKDHPKDSGIVFTLEEWLRRLDKVEGNPNGIWRTSGKAQQPGIFVAINPHKFGGSKDSDVTDYRHVLIENDHLPIPEQWNLLVQSNLPCAAVIHSGGRSLHAIVRVDARDRKEYDERCKALFDHFKEYQVDQQNRNPGRMTRLPNCRRRDSRQELLALNVGASSFTTWMIEKECESIGEEIKLSHILAFDPTQDPNNLIGKRWICKGSSCLWVGQAGIGKSSLAMQAAIAWAICRSLFGITPVKALKSLIIQHENDLGDLAEMFQGVWLGMGLPLDDKDLIQQVNRNLVIIRERSRTGQSFLLAIRRLIEKHQPDLVWVDPLYTYMGDDISKQSVCSQFLCDGLGPITEATGVTWMLMHHTGKPSQDPRAKSGWKKHDHNYAGLGSSLLTNWPRAIVSLDSISDTEFVMRLGKRGKRAAAKDYDGNPTDTVYLSHSKYGICWTQIPKPAEADEDDKGGGREYSRGSDDSGKKKSKGRPRKDNGYDPHEFSKTLSTSQSYGFTEIENLLKDQFSFIPSTCANRIKELATLGLIARDPISQRYTIVNQADLPISTDAPATGDNEPF